MPPAGRRVYCLPEEEERGEREKEWHYTDNDSTDVVSPATHSVEV